MNEMLRVIIDGKVMEYPKGTPYLRLRRRTRVLIRMILYLYL